MTTDLLAHEPARRRRGAVVLLVAAAVVALALTQVRDDDPPAAPPDPLTVVGEATATDDGQLRLVVRNDGTATVTALRGGVGSYGLRRPVEVAPGETRVLVLEQADACPPEPAPTPAALSLSVRSTGTIREVRLPLPLAADVTCGAG